MDETSHRFEPGTTATKGLAVVAIGGHALMPPAAAGRPVTIEAELAGAADVCRQIARLAALGWRIVLTHGNGPQVGAALLRSERCAHEVYRQPLNLCVALTQGEIGSVLQRTLRNALADEGVNTPVAAVLTQVLVSADDPALEAPTKPIGPCYSPARADILRRRHGWVMVRDDAGPGYRRAVPSPAPTVVLEEPVIRRLVDGGAIVIALGGGGIPVVQRGDRLVAIDAVVDKDRASALLASHLGADLLVLATDIDRVYVDFESPDRRGLDHVSVATVRAHHAAGQFPPGTMGPKVEGALQFLEAGGTEAIIACASDLEHAVGRRGGTHIGRAHGRTGRAGQRAAGIAS